MPEIEADTCRFCGTSTALMVSICSAEGVELALEAKMSTHLPVQFSADDGLPQSVCYPCVDLLLTWDAFVSSCVEREAHLRSISATDPVEEVPFAEESFSESDEEPLSKMKTPESISDNGEEFRCKKCGKKVASKQQLNKHKSACSKSSGSYPCHLCPCVYKLFCNLDRHINREHKSNQVECPVCQISMNSKKLRSHLQSVHAVRRQEEKRFKCKLCDQLFANKFAKSDHFKSVHMREMIKCTQCSFEGLRASVKKHEKTAHTTKKYPCTMCSGRFKTLHMLKTHMACHSDQRSYICDICGRAFKRLNNVRDHIKCHDKKSNQCRVCGHLFARKRYLAVHERTMHNFYADGIVPEEKGFECSVCGAKLKWKKNLLAHMRIHTGDKPYGCKICHRGFVCPGSLKTHLSKHSSGEIHGSEPMPIMTMDVGVLSHLQLQLSAP